MLANSASAMENGRGIAAFNALPSGHFRPRQGVVSVRALDTIVLLDVSTERYHSLDTVAARIWELLNDGAVPATVVELLCAQYDVSEDRVTADVAAQIASFLHEGLLEPAGGESGDACRARAVRNLLPASTLIMAQPTPSHPVNDDHRREVEIPSMFRGGLMIAMVKGLLKARGFAGTLAWIQGRVLPIAPSVSATLEAVKAVENRIATAGAFYPGRARCLEQSLALYYVLRRQGVAVRYVQGVQPYPFEAHAWIEYQGQVINDVPEHVAHFARFPDQLP